MKLSVILITYNFAGLAIRAIDSVLAQTKNCELEIIVVDNASSDGTPSELKAAYPGLQLIQNQENVGFARACNQAIGVAKGEYLVLLNSDCFLSNDCFGEMRTYLDSHPEVGIAGARLLNSDLTPQGSCRKFVTAVGEFLATLPYLNKLPFQCFHRDILSAANTETAILVDYVSGACFMFHRSVLESIGGFDEQFFMYSEEEEFCFRARKAGIRTVYVPTAVAVHMSGASFGKNIWRRSTLVAASRLKYYRKYHSSLQVLTFRIALAPALVVRACFGAVASVFPSTRDKAHIYTLDALVTLRTYIVGPY